MSTLFGLFPFLLKLYADSGYQGAKFRQGVKRVCEQINVEIVKRSDAGKFVVLPKRWIVDNCLAQPMPAVGQGLGMSQSKRSRVSALGIRPADGPKAM
jgi:hypothetical protein